MTRPFARYAEEAEAGDVLRLPVRHGVGHRARGSARVASASSSTTTT